MSLTGVELEHRVLIAEDEPVSRLTLTRVLESWGYEVTVALDGDQAWRLLQSENAPRLAIVDWVMPGMDGIAICRRLKADPALRHAYVIVLTANATTSDIVTALEAGADDFVAKPFELEELRVRLRAGQRIVALQRELQRRASHDDLTGIFSRRMVLDVLGREHAAAVRANSHLSVAMLDLDWFKRVNDTHGHHAGDAVLQEAARRIAASVRMNDTVGRYGGEEFLLVMPGCGSRSAVAICDRVRAVVSATPITTGRAQVHATVSIGATTTTAPRLIAPEALITQADQALYQAKARGRNRVELWLLEHAGPVGGQ